MRYVSIHPDLVPLIEGIKPFLPTKGRVAAEGVASIIQVLASHHGQQAIESMSEALRTFGPKDHQVTIKTAAGPVTLSLGIAAVLFLIFILLLLSGSLLAIGTGISEGARDLNLPIFEESGTAV